MKKCEMKVEKKKGVLLEYRSHRGGTTRIFVMGVFACSIPKVVIRCE